MPSPEVNVVITYEHEGVPELGLCRYRGRLFVKTFSVNDFAMDYPSVRCIYCQTELAMISHEVLPRKD